MELRRKAGAARRTMLWRAALAACAALLAGWTGSKAFCASSISPSLSARFAAARSVSEVLDMLGPWRSQLDAQTRTAAVARLASLAPGGIAKWHSLRGTLADLTFRLGKELEEIPGPSIAMTLQACATLGYNPGKDFLLSANKQVVSKFNTLSASDASNVIWAFAVFDYTPLKGMFFNRVMDRFTEKLTTLTPKELANAVWAITKLTPHVKKEDLRDLLAKLRHHLCMLDIQAFVHVLDTVRVLEIYPGREFMETLVEETSKRLPAFTGQQLTVTLVAFAKQEYQPGALILARIVAEMNDKLSSYKADDIVSSLVSLAALYYKPSFRFIDAILEAAEGQLSAFKVADVTKILWVLAKWGIESGGPFRAALTTLTKKQMHAFTGEDLGRSLFALSIFTRRPGDALLTSLVEEAGKKLDVTQARDISRILHALGKLGFTPDVPVEKRKMSSIEEEFADIFAEKLAARQASVVANPRQAFLDKAGWALQHRLDEFGSRMVTDCLWGYALMEYHPGDVVLKAFTDRVMAILSVFRPQEIVQVLCAFARLGYHPGPDVLATINAESERKQEFFSAKDLERKVDACAQLEHQPATPPTKAAAASENAPASQRNEQAALPASKEPQKKAGKAQDLLEDLF